MPMPKPHDGEAKDDFLDRCMADELMNSDYPDEKQRYAVCNSIWEKERTMVTKVKEQRKAIPRHDTATSEADWDGPGNEANLKSDQDYAYYRQAYAWQDAEGDPANKSSYKFIHHEVSADGDPGAANIRGCQTGIAVLNGARGGADIPDADRQGVYNHLSGHLKDADVEPAPLRSYEGEGVEMRSFELTGVELREGENGEGITLRGHAAVFNQLSDVIFGFREQIAPGAFARTIKSADVRALVNHDPNLLLGRTKSKTLRLKEDEDGLFSEIDLPDTSYARDVEVSVRRGDMTQMSFAFSPHGKKGEEWDYSDPAKPVRTLRDVDLFDVSVVTFPAYPQTDVKVRSAFEAAGLDFNALAGALEKRQAGELGEEEKQIIKSSIEILNGCLTAEAAAPGDGGLRELTGGSDGLERARRKLEILAAGK